MKSRETMHIPEIRKVLFIFLDGIGIGTKDPARNPFFATELPFLQSLLDGKLPSLRQRRIDARHAACIPVDATMGVAGFPQSGTGQAALYTGVNTAKIIGQHFGPYLYSTLKPVVERENIFRRLLNEGIERSELALANAFPQRFFDYMASGRQRMVAGMYAAHVTEIPFRDIAMLKKGMAVSTDITAERWADIGHPDAPVLSPYQAGRQLAHIAVEHSFSLYEYFMTDKAGHERSMTHAVRILQDIDDFLRGVWEARDSSLTIILSSDHGNLEELSVKTHTRNPIPLLVFGAQIQSFISLLPLDKRPSISDITPAICRFLCP